MPSKRNQGFGLLHALLVLAVGTSVIGIVSQRSANISKSSKKTASRADLLGLKSNIYNNVDCPATFSTSLGFGPKGTPCTPGFGPTGYIDLRSKSGTLINSDGSSQFGKWNALAYCSSSGIEIRFVSLLPSSYGNLADKQWVGKTAPEDLSHYRLDELTKQPYSWMHPLSAISKPGPEGICNDWFQSSATTSGTCDGFVRKVNFKNKTATCSPVQKCNYPDILMFDSSSNQFVCNSGLISTSYNNSKAATDTYIKSIVDNFYNNVWNNILPKVTYTNTEISAFPNFSDFHDITRSSFSDCAKREQMKCPNGYIMWGYEAKLEDGQNCRVRCAKLKRY